MILSSITDVNYHFEGNEMSIKMNEFDHCIFDRSLYYHHLNVDCKVTFLIGAVVAQW